MGDVNSLTEKPQQPGWELHKLFCTQATKYTHTLTMDMSLERDGGVIGTLFQQIINDMKVSALQKDWIGERAFLLRSDMAARQLMRQYEY